MRYSSSHAFTLGLLSLGAACGGVSNESRTSGGDSSSGGGGSGAANGGNAAGMFGGGAALGGGGSGAANGGNAAGMFDGGAALGGGGSGAANGGSAGMCGGPAPPSGGQSGGQATREAVQCYVSDPTVGGVACLPPDDPTLVAKLADHIQSIGFVVSFVIDAAETIPMPAACEPFVQCCEAVPEDYRQTQCYDWLDGAYRDDGTPSAEPVDGCPVFPTNLREYFGCAGSNGTGGAPSNPGDEGGAAGASDEPVSRFLCCYRTCGYRVAI